MTAETEAIAPIAARKSDARERPAVGSEREAQAQENSLIDGAGRIRKQLHDPEGGSTMRPSRSCGCRAPGERGMAAASADSELAAQPGTGRGRDRMKRAHSEPADLDSELLRRPKLRIANRPRRRRRLCHALDQYGAGYSANRRAHERAARSLGNCGARLSPKAIRCGLKFLPIRIPQRAADRSRRRLSRSIAVERRNASCDPRSPSRRRLRFISPSAASSCARRM